MLRRRFLAKLSQSSLALWVGLLVGCGEDDFNRRSTQSGNIQDDDNLFDREDLSSQDARQDEQSQPQNTDPLAEQDENPEINEDPFEQEISEPIQYIDMYDMNAVALYYDGNHGPNTGVIKVDYILAGKPVELEFWHGHGGRQHYFTFLPEHMEQLKLGKVVTITTSSVDNHEHTLFINPSDPRYRVDPTNPIKVPV